MARDRLADEIAAPLAGGGDEAQVLAPGRQEDADDPRVEELAQPPHDEVEQPLDVGLGGDGVPDLDQRLELPRPVRRRLVEARVLDRHGRLAREQRDELLVLVGEVLPTGLLGQVEVPVGDPRRSTGTPRNELIGG